MPGQPLSTNNDWWFFVRTKRKPFRVSKQVQSYGKLSCNLNMSSHVKSHGPGFTCLVNIGPGEPNKELHPHPWLSSAGIHFGSFPVAKLCSPRRFVGRPFVYPFKQCNHSSSENK